MKQIIRVKFFFKFLISLLPQVLRDVVNKKIKQKKKKASTKATPDVITMNQIDDLLSKLNLKCNILLHSSITNFGCKIDGDVGLIADVILSKMDFNKYALLLPAIPFSGTMIDYLDGIVDFNIQNAPNKMGAISNYLMKRKDIFRSFHPTHSVLAIGKNATYYIKGHEKCLSPFCKESPYYKHMKNDGKILMFGVNLNSVTSFHVYEDLIIDSLPFKVYKNKDYLINSTNGFKKVSILLKCHSQFLSSKRDCERARKLLIQKNYIQTFHLGNSEISLLDAKGLTIVLLEMLLDGQSIYGRCIINYRQKKRIKSEVRKLNNE